VIAVNVPAKFEVVALHVPEIIRGTQKCWQSLDTPTLCFLTNCSWAFVRMDHVNVAAKFDVRSFTRSSDRGTRYSKIGQSLDTPMIPFLPNLSWPFVRMDPVNVSAKFAVRSFTRSWDSG